MTQSSLSICVFCGSSKGLNPAHMQLAARLGAKIATRGDRLVYGGGGIGLMGAAARAAHKNGADVRGIIPEVLAKIEQTFTEVTHEVVADMHTRKRRMYEESSAFIVLPGGIGTLEEAVEMLSWQRLNLHNKPLVFLSSTGYWDGFLQGLSQIIKDGFAPESFRDVILSANSVQQAFDMIERAISATPQRHKL